MLDVYSVAQYVSHECSRLYVKRTFIKSADTLIKGKQQTRSLSIKSKTISYIETCRLRKQQFLPLLATWDVSPGETEKFFVLSMEFLSLPSRKERGETAVFTGCETCKVFGFNAIKYSLLLLLLQ